MDDIISKILERIENKDNESVLSIIMELVEDSKDPEETIQIIRNDKALVEILERDCYRYNLLKKDNIYNMNII